MPFNSNSILYEMLNLKKKPNITYEKLLLLLLLLLLLVLLKEFAELQSSSDAILQKFTYFFAHNSDVSFTQYFFLKK